MSIDGNGFYELGRKDRTNTHGDPDYFFETGKFQFKPGMEKGYLKKLGLWENEKNSNNFISYIYINIHYTYFHL